MSRQAAPPTGMLAALRARSWPSAAVVALCYLVGTLLASVITDPSHPRALAPVPLLLAVLAGLVGAATLGPLARRLPVPFGARLLVVALLAYLLSTVSNLVEAVLFIDQSAALVPVTGAILALALAVPISLLCVPERADRSVGGLLRETLRTRHWLSWTWRTLVTAALWVPVYLIFAAADAPFVHRYYHQTGTTFAVPGTGTIVGAELSRGLLHALVLGALAALLGRDRLRSWFWPALAFATLNAWLPLLERTDWPYYLRAANLVEITCDAVVYGAMVAMLLIRRRPVAS